MPQVHMGDVRLMLPCGESQAAARQEDGASSPASGGPIAVERSNSAFASGDLDLGLQAPNMLVVVLAGFQATSRTTEARVSNFATSGMMLLQPAYVPHTCLHAKHRHFQAGSTCWYQEVGSLAVTRLA